MLYKPRNFTYLYNENWMHTGYVGSENPFQTEIVLLLCKVPRHPNFSIRNWAKVLYGETIVIVDLDDFEEVANTTTRGVS